MDQILNLLKLSISRPLSPKEEDHHRLKQKLGLRVMYRVHYKSFAYQLAVDMQSAPGIVNLIGIILRNHKL